MAGPRQVIDIPIAAGLNTKADPRAMQPPGLAVCEDVQFDELGGVQTRPQYQAITDSASNTIADIRKIVEYGDELVAFSKDKLWSYATGDGLWTQRAEYLAVKIDEQARFVTTGEQFDCDRAELGGITMYCWTETTPTGTDSYVAAIDTASGSVKLSPVIIKAGATRPRLLVSTNRIFLLSVVAATPALWVRTYNPADLTSAETNLGLGGMVAYDATIDPDTPAQILVAVSRGVTGYNAVKFSEAPASSGSTLKSVTADGAISIASTTGGTQRVCVTYSASTAIISDILTNAFVDVSVAVSTGTASSATVNQITCGHNGTLFQLFWSAAEVATGGTFQLETNTITNAGTAGTEADVVLRCGLVSRAFVHDSATYVWAAFAGISQGDLTAQLQNSYFLYRSDGLLVAKAIATNAGGFAATSGRLAGVQSLGSGAWAWCGEYRRIVPLGQEQKGYAAKSPQDVNFTFDSAEARRTAQLGETLYIAGGQLSQYDGRGVTEVGFHTYPWEMGVVSAAGSNLNGTYNWQQTYSWFNAKGEFERSTTATIFAQAISTAQANMVGVALHTTAKTGTNGEAAVEYWRQIDAAPVSAPFYLVTSKNPASTGDNKYFANDPTAGVLGTFSDDLADSALISREDYPENGGLTLASTSPAAASIVYATQDRLIVAGIPGNPHRVAYSRLRGEGEVASFNDTLFVDLPPAGGPITAIGFLNETLIVFKASAVYALPGDGYDNNGGGQNYGPARLLDNDVGAISAEAIELTPKGILFKSNKGWFVLTQGWNAQYVGVGADLFDADTIVACHSMNSQHQVRCVSSARTLLWDYLVDTWFVWTTSSVSATMWNNIHHIVNSTVDGVLAQAGTYSGAGDLPGLDLETAWIKTSGIQGFGLIRRVLILGEYLGACDLRIRVAYNYKETSAGPVWVDDKTWTVSPTTVNGPLQLEHGPSRPKCESLKIRITAQAIGVTTHPISQAINLTALSLEVAIRQGAFAGLPAAQKQ